MRKTTVGEQLYSPEGSADDFQRELEVEARKRCLPHAGVLVLMGRVISEVGEIPSGHLYARLMDRMDLSAYEGAVRLLVKLGLVERSGDVLKWKG